MHRSAPFALLVLVAVATGVGGLLASLVSTNALFTGSPWQLPAIASLVLLALVTATFVAIGNPWGSRQRTPYW